MKKCIAAAMVAALVAGATAPPVLAGTGYRHRGAGYSQSYYAGNYFRHRPYYGNGYRHHRYGGRYYFHGDGAVVLGVLAGAVVLGALLSRPAPRPALWPVRAPVLRSPSGAPLGGCLSTTGTGTWNGRPARFGGTMCYDPAGRAYILPGSQRFLDYLR